jgi:hypothetical protein
LRPLAQMAVGHLDMIIGQLRAEVEDEPAKERPRATERPTFAIRVSGPRTCTGSRAWFIGSASSSA